MGRTAKVIQLPNARSPEQWAEKINVKWHEQVSTIFETANLLESSKEELGWSVWKKMVKEKCNFSVRAGLMLVAIADCPNLRDVNHGSLPPCWRTLHELTKLTPEQFEKGIETGAIHAGMERKDVKELRGLETKTKKEKKQELPQSLDDWCGDFSLRIGYARSSLQEKDRLELFEHLKQAIGDLVEVNAHV